MIFHFLQVNLFKVFSLIGMVLAPMRNGVHVLYLGVLISAAISQSLQDAL